LLPYVSFKVEAAIEFARRVNPAIEVIQVSATSGQGMDQWLGWIERGGAEALGARQESVDALKRRVAELEGQLASRGH
ncbi:MAG: hydrogenase accessory protein HypB, partial [Rhodocyclales bacterium]|nr:hydrogenase accessory protein HypB [Rhodocyclales bacterium]